MYNVTVTEKINETADELFPNLQLDFKTSCSQFNIFIGHINITSSVSIDRLEIIHNNVFDESGLKIILKKTSKKCFNRTEKTYTK